MADTTPVEASTVPTPGAELLHVPPAGVLPSVRVPPMHADAVPEMDAGSASTVTTAVARQPVDNV